MAVPNTGPPHIGPVLILICLGSEEVILSPTIRRPSLPGQPQTGKVVTYVVTGGKTWQR
ncbi:hypothetical protein BH24CHL10_BH24CHL10_07170 [soil metagenome]